MSGEVQGKKRNELVKIGDDILVKGSGIIQIRVMNGEKRSLLGRKLSNALFKIAQKAGIDKEAYSTSRLELNEMTKFNSNDVAKLKQAAIELTSLKVELDVTSSENGGTRTVGATQLFSTVLFQSNGKIIFEIPMIAKRMLSDSSKFALINMHVQGDIDSTCGYILYEQCLLYIDEGKTPEFTVEEWRIIFECNDDKSYQEFKHFNQKIIKHAVEEVNRVTDVLVNVHYKKQGRSVSSLYFVVTKKPQYLLDISIQDEKLRAEEKLIECGVNENVARKLVLDYEYELIMGNIEYAEAQLANSKINNLAGFVVEAIKNDYRPKESPLVTKFKESQVKTKKESAARQEQLDQEQFEQNKKVAEKHAKAAEHYDNLTDTKREALLQRFEKHLAVTNPVTHKSYVKSGIDAKTVRMSLLQYISSEEL